DFSSHKMRIPAEIHWDGTLRYFENLEGEHITPIEKTISTDYETVEDVLKKIMSWIVPLNPQKSHVKIIGKGTPKLFDDLSAIGWLGFILMISIIIIIILKNKK